MKTMLEEQYTSGDYLNKNPTWHVEESPWKAAQVARMMKQNGIVPKTVCEVGCGAGEVLRQLQKHLNDECVLAGYDVSPQAFELCKGKSNERLHFKLADIRQEKGAFFDVVLVLDVIEHLEDCYAFLRSIKSISQYKIFHIPLDLSVQTVLRGKPLLNDREHFGHIHYFTKDTALRTLEDVGYRVIDHFYTAVSIDIPSDLLKSHLLRLPRKLLFSIHRDLAVRILGGYRLLVLAS
jgi:SAM-dependent methyltransferase